MQNGDDHNVFSTQDIAPADQARLATMTTTQSSDVDTVQLPTIEPVHWTATESVAQQRTGKWYRTVFLCFAAIVTIDVVLYFLKVTDLMAMISSLVLIAMILVALLVSAKLPAHESSYTLDGEGVTINGRFHGFNEYRAFGVRQNGKLWQLVLIPNKRFAMEVVTYIDEQNGERIVDILASVLPMEEVPENGVDKLIDRLKI